MQKIVVHSFFFLPLLTIYFYIFHSSLVNIKISAMLKTNKKKKKKTKTKKNNQAITGSVFVQKCALF